MEHLKPEEISALIAKERERGIRILAILNKQRKYYDVFNTEIGKTIFTEVLGLLEERLEKIVNETATSEERAEYRVLRKVMDSWVAKISSYEKKVKEIKERIYA